MGTEVTVCDLIKSIKSRFSKLKKHILADESSGKQARSHKQEICDSPDIDLVTLTNEATLLKRGKALVAPIDFAQEKNEKEKIY